MDADHHLTQAAATAQTGRRLPRVLPWLPALLLIALLVAGRLEGYRPVAIRTGSMAPTLPVGALVITHAQPADTLRPGQIVTFHDPALGGGLVTHRIRSVQRDHGRLTVETRGDANDASERWTVPATASLGRTVWSVPHVGRLLLEPRRYVAVAAVGLSLGWLGFFLLARLLRAGGTTGSASGPAGGRHRRTTPAKA